MTVLSQYDPQAIQEKWSKFWETKGYFHSKPHPDRKPFSIVIPPPNVTGALHLGHALNGVLQDVMIRSKRMQGFEALWIPGADHAGIATQAVVEKRMFEEEGKTRHDVGRQELVRRIWAWKDEYEQRIISQLKAMGSSCDWQRWRFTLDETCARAVRQTFFNMFRDNLIYRGKRLVNWDVQLQTAVADDEVYHDEVAGHLWHFKYPVEGTSEFLEIATTRPETMLGDTAVAVHPDDPRYQHLIGKQVRLPLMDRLIPIVADGLLVDPKFGTGVVKVTPAHDPNDYQCGLRNGLEMINILTPDGKINANGGKYQGEPRFHARKAVVADLEALGLVSKIEPHTHNVGHSDRSKTPIEPYLSDQWFIRMDTLAEKAMDAVRDGSVNIRPARYADTYLRWLGEKRDWCISRQLWWGHQIPVWISKPLPDKSATESCTNWLTNVKSQFKEIMDYQVELNEEHKKEGDGEPYAIVHVCLLHDFEQLVGQLESSEFGFRRSDDVLDTWFSSGLWPHSTMGWPAETEELKYYYPTSVLSTAREIITLWVARMVIMSQFNLDKVPFHDVFIHPVIQDGNGMPMKKSLGNGVDPFDIIAKYGTDSMRYTLTSMTTETQDVRMPVKKETLPDGRTVNTSEKFEIGRNFGTKIYNASKFVLMNLEGFTAGPIDTTQLATEDRWILHRLSKTIRAITTALDAFQFGDAGRLMYDFVWSEFCDWYIEIIKPRFRNEETKAQAQRVAAVVLDNILRLLHPVMPFVTEEVWQALNTIAPSRGYPDPLPASEAVTIAPWPQPQADWEDEQIEQRMGFLQDVIRSARNIRAQFNVKGELDIAIECSADLGDFLIQNATTVRQLAKIREIAASEQMPRPSLSAAHVLPSCKIYVPLSEHIDVNAELGKQEKKLADLQKRLKAIESKLANAAFVANAPPEVVEQQRQSLIDLQQQIDAVKSIIADLKS